MILYVENLKELTKILELIGGIYHMIAGYQGNIQNSNAFLQAMNKKSLNLKIQYHLTLAPEKMQFSKYISDETYATYMRKMCGENCNSNECNQKRNK